MSAVSFFESFVSNIPLDQKKALEKLRADILKVAPQIEEGVSTGVPAFKYKGSYLASMNTAKTHLSLFIMRGSALKVLRNELKGFDVTNVAVRFTPEQSIPAELVTKVITFRMNEIDQKKDTHE